MTVANPIAWGLLLLALPIILLFLLKMRFRKELTATAVFWQHVFEERKNRRVAARLRYLISLILALLFLACLTLAVLNPQFPDPQFTATHLTSTQPGQQPQQEQHIIIIIENSARMNAWLDESGTTRLDHAKQQADKMLQRLAGQQVAVISASIQPAIISGFTDQTSPLRWAVSRISATDFPSDLPAALRLAEKIDADATLYVYPGDPIGIDNVAITQFQPRRLPETLADYEIFVEVVNFGTQTVRTRLKIECQDELVDVIPLSLEPNRPTRRIIRNTSPLGGLFRATLLHNDLFPTDNTVWAFLSQQYTQRVLLFGQENFFLGHALRSLPLTEIHVIDSIPDTIPPDSVLIFHQTVPAELPSGNILIIDPLSDCRFFQVGSALDRPIAARIDADNRLVRFISPGLEFANAKRINPLEYDTFSSHSTPATQPSSNRPGYKALIETAGGDPLYLHFQTPECQMLVLSADLNQGDFALRTAFPMLLSQALTYFRQSEDMIKAYSTSDVVRLTVPTAIPQILLRSPSGREETFQNLNSTITPGRLGEVGIWTLFDPTTRRELTQIACNLFCVSESDFANSNRQQREGVLTQAESNEMTLTGNQPGYPIWFCLVLFALLLTVMEWFFYQRRWID